ncbi:hypothetical protein [Herbaspirillum robiniae]|uniref:hypothetical protein n=1 Tax=Herbaspirillum robiniae TaxID=2014887 RepID=UPI00101ADC76|nr:hypothetical protein [Herbaspirillum robiniae]
MDELAKKTITDLIAVEGVADELRNRIISSPTGPMVKILSQILRTPALDGDLEEIAQRAVQPAVRAKAYRTLLAGEATWVAGTRWEWVDIRYCEGRMEHVHESRSLSIARSLMTDMNTAARDRSATVRNVASEALVRKMNDPAFPVRALALRFSKDASASVARRGQFILEELEKRRLAVTRISFDKVNLESSFSMGDFVLSTPDGRHEFEFLYVGEPPHGDSYHSIRIDGAPFPGLAWGSPIYISSDSRYVAFSWMAKPIERETIVIDLTDRRYLLLPRYCLNVKILWPNIVDVSIPPYPVVYRIDEQEKWISFPESDA